VALDCSASVNESFMKLNWVEISWWLIVWLSREFTWAVVGLTFLNLKRGWVAHWRAIRASAIKRSELIKARPVNSVKTGLKI